MAALSGVCPRLFSRFWLRQTSPHDFTISVTPVRELRLEMRETRFLGNLDLILFRREAAMA